MMQAAQFAQFRLDASTVFDIAIIDSLAVEHYDLLLFRERGWGNERFLGSVCSRSG
jgi:hypothetical protein